MLRAQTSTQSPSAWALLNFVKSAILAKLGDLGYQYTITPAETAAGLVVGNLTLGFPPGDFRRYGAVGDGVTDDTTAIQRAHTQGDRSEAGAARPFCPVGIFLHTTTITPCVLGQTGAGTKRSRMVSRGVHTFTVASGAGWDRPAVKFDHFAVDSDDGTSCDGKFAFYFGGVAGGAASAYNSGFTARDLEIGRNNRMGGGFYLKDLFRFNIENIGMTNVSRMIQLVGSVVQGKVRNVTSNNDSAGATLSKYGLTTESASYSDIGTAGPENVRFIDCSYIRGTRGIDHAMGLDVEFVNFDTESDAIGMNLNAACNVRGGVIAPGPGATSWVGIMRGVSPATPDDGTVVENVDINLLRAPTTPASSYAVDIGDGVSPVYGFVMKKCRIRGTAASIANGVRSRDLRDGTFEDNFIRNSVVTGSVMSLGGKRIYCVRTRAPGGTITYTDGGDTAANGAFLWNEVSTVTLTLSDSRRWTVCNPEAAATGDVTRLVGEGEGTFTFTETGCTTSPTATGRYIVQGRVVTLYIPAVTGTSNSTALTLTGLPASLYPARTRRHGCAVVDSGNTQIGFVDVSSAGVLTFFLGTAFSAFANTGTKGTSAFDISYGLD